MFLSNQRRLKSFTNECSYFYFHAFTKGHLRLYLSFFTCSANWWKSVPNIWHHLLLRWNCTIGLLHTFVYHLCIWRHLLAKPFLLHFFCQQLPRKICFEINWPLPNLKKCDKKDRLIKIRILIFEKISPHCATSGVGIKEPRAHGINKFYNF